MSASNANLTILQWHAPMYFMVVPIRIYVVNNKLDFNNANFEVHLPLKLERRRTSSVASEIVDSLATEVCSCYKEDPKTKTPRKGH